MTLNFPLILVLATFVCGLIWGLYALVGKFSGRAKDSRMPILVEYAASFFPVLFIVLVLRSFIFEPFRIPSGSMVPTLLVGDFILVNKFSYGVRLPVIHKKILPVDEPETGDVAVFRFPNDPKLDYIKRVIGTPGDNIEYKNKMFFVNGEEVLAAIGDGVDRHGYCLSQYRGSIVKRECKRVGTVVIGSRRIREQPVSIVDNRTECCIVVVGVADARANENRRNGDVFVC